MKIIDITPETESHYFCCLEEYSDDIREAGDAKQKWYNQMKDKGLRVKYAMDDNGVIGGMIQYIPVEQSSFEGKDLYVVLCIWVHGHKQGRGDHRKKGMGKALLKAAEDEVRQLGAKGLVTWGVMIPVFMRASWFKKHGYKVVDKSGIMRLLWKPFSDQAVPPKFIKPEKLPSKGKGKVNVTVFSNGWCQNMNVACARAIRASMDFPGKTDLHLYDTADKEIFREWGISDAIYIDGKEVNIGPAPSFKKVRKKIEKRVKSLAD
ncbi:MAG: GNAT family N-acetyltransferase [Bacteroidota bacterium]|nr:GNAT family N-acetyltransferase [Bacteroidota bacterium]